MGAILEKIELNKDTSEILRQFMKKVHIKKGKRYQIVLETGDLVTIAITTKKRAETSEDDEDSIMKDISVLVSHDDAILNEPDLYDPNYGRTSL